MSEEKLEPQFRDAVLAIGLITVILLFTIIFLYWKFTVDAIGHWLGPVISVNALLNSGIVLYFAVLRYRRAQAQSSK